MRKVLLWNWRMVAAIILLCLASPPKFALAQTQCEPLTVQIDSRVDYDRDIRPIFDSKCVACHSATLAEAGLNLAGPSAHGGLVARPSTLDPQFTLVQPPHPALSLLWQMVQCTQPPVGRAMPIGAPQLSFEERRKLFSWIARGAPAGASGSTRQVAITPTLSGTWYDPSAKGQGFALEVVDSPARQVVLFWLTFSQQLVTENGARVVEHEKRWFVGSGTHDGQVANLTLLSSSGGTFDSGSLAAQSTPVGSATLRFHSCASATLLYSTASEADGAAPPLTRSVALRRLTPSASCAASVNR